MAEHYDSYFHAENLVKHLGGKAIFNQLNLRIDQGESVVILGRSGEGKSVLLRTLLGLVKPDSGAVSIKGTDVTHYSNRQLSPLRKKMGVLFQDGALFDFLSVGENVSFPLVESGVKDADELKQRAHDALEMVGLPNQMDARPLEISGGMRKRVSLARAIIANPDCILCDEPTSGLDPASADSINSLIRDMVDALNATAVVVSHDMNSMRKIADRVVMLRDGQVAVSGSPEEIAELEARSLR